MALLSVALEQAAAHLNDPSKTEWTDAKLMPRAKSSHVDLQVALYEFGLPVLREKAAEISVAVDDEDPTTPADMIEPISLQEKKQGDPNTSYVPMTEVDFIPEYLEDSEALRFWSWREQTLYVGLATTARTVLLRYWKGLAAIVDGSSEIGLILGEAFMAPKIASLCYAAVGQHADAGFWQNEAKTKLDSILRANVRGMGHKPARRIPFSVMQRARRRSFFGVITNP